MKQLKQMKLKELKKYIKEILKQESLTEYDIIEGLSHIIIYKKWTNPFYMYPIDDFFNNNIIRWILLKILKIDDYYKYSEIENKYIQNYFK